MNNKFFQKAINFIFTFALVVGLFLPASSTLALPQEPGPAARPAQSVTPVTPVNPTDTNYVDDSQWNLNGTWGINAPIAWGVTTGAVSPRTVVAVLDTGFTDHTELDGRILSGYDFVSTADNDGTPGRDSEAHDPGDYGASCGDSSWEGTRVAGIIAAAANNGTGIAGIDWNANILPVRVIGTCGSAAPSDIVDGMRWAAGLHVGLMALNPSPAKVLNVGASLPGVACTAYQTDIDAIIQHGAVIVAPAGDTGTTGAATNNFPANCDGVITVAATDSFGKRADYSNYGSSPTAVEISAPGGGNGQGLVLSTSNSGTTTPNSSGTFSIYDTKDGHGASTSMAAAQVSGTVSLMFAANPYITPDQVLKILQKTAKNFNTSVSGDPLPWCSSANCGSGILDAGEAVRLANMPDLIITNVTVTPVLPITSNSFNVNISVKNQGGLNLHLLNADSLVYRGVYVDSKPIDHVLPDDPPGNIGCLSTPAPPDYFSTHDGMSTIAPGQPAATASVLISGLSTGPHTIYAYTDANCTVDESFDNNNNYVAPADVTNIYAGVPSSAPVLISPENKSFTISKTPKLTVSPLAGASSYNFQVSTDPLFATTRVDVTTPAAGTSYTLTAAQSLPYGTYYWRAKSSLFPDWSAPNKFGVTFQTSPLYNAYLVTAKPAFKWMAVTGAVGYKLQVSKSDSDWTTPEIDHNLGKVLTYTNPLALDYGTHYWRVQACSNSACTTFLSPQFDFGSKFTLTPPLSAKPVLVSPLTKALLTSNTPTLTWKKVTDDDRYQVQIDNLSTFVSPEQDFITDTGAVSYIATTSPTTLPDGVYYWHVRTSNYLTAPGAWSTVNSFTIDTLVPLAPVLSAPADLASAAGTPVFSWKAVATATKYQFQYDNDADLLSPNYTSVELTTLTHTPPTMAVGIYYWHVRAKDAAGNWGNWSTPRTVTINLPIPLAPVLTAPTAALVTNNQKPIFNWNAVAYGNTYQIDISTATNFTPVEQTFTGGVGILTYTPATNLLAGIHYWRVRAMNTNGLAGAGPFSAYRAFTIDLTPPLEPTLKTPANLVAVPATPTFSWLAATTAVKYKFEYATDLGFTTIVHTSAELSTLTYKPPTMTPGTYYWRVSARDAAGNWSVLPGASSRVTILPAPVLSSSIPPSVTNDPTPDFSWSNFTGAEITYKLEISTTSTFIPGPATQTLSGLGTPPYTLAAPLIPLTPDGLYYWHVRAENSALTLFGPWSLTRSFTLDTLAPLAPALSAPLDNVSVIATPAFSWLAAATAVKYKFEYATDLGFTSIVHTSAELSTLTYKPPTMTPGTYHWRVSARDVAGNWSVLPGTSRTVTILPAPVLSLSIPPSVTNDPTPDFNWSPVAGTGITYTLEVSTISTFIPGPATQTLSGLGAPPYTLITPLTTNGLYYWHVRAVSGGSILGPWSLTRSFTLDTLAPPAPVLSAPADNLSVVGTPIFSWLAASTATKYQFEYADDSAFTTNVVTFSELTTLKITLPVPGMTSGTYHWRVKAKDAAGNWSLYSTVRTVIIQPTPPAPVLTAPANAYLTNNPTPTFTWDAVAGAAITYEIQISTNITFNPAYLVPQTLGSSGTSSYTALPALSGGTTSVTYYWHVRTVSGGSIFGTWSAYRSFTVDTTAPTLPTVFLSSPADNASVNGTPNFQWKSVATATKYQFEYDVNPAFLSASDSLHSLHYTSAELTGTNYTPTTMSLGTYFWHVRAKDAAGNWSDWNASVPPTRTVSVTPKATTGVPTLLSPANGSLILDTSTPLSWKAVTGAVRYQVQINQHSTFIPADFDDETPLVSPAPTSITPLASLNGTYYWRVRKVDVYGGVGPWSAVWRLSINQVIPLAVTSSAMTGLSALAAPADTNTPTFTWDSVEYGVTYQLQVDDNNDFATPSFDDTADTTSRTPLEPLANGNYFWRVRAFNVSGTPGPWSETWTITINALAP